MTDGPLMETTPDDAVARGSAAGGPQEAQTTGKRHLGLEGDPGEGPSLARVAWDVTRALLLPRHLRNFVLPSYTPWQWFECDVFELTGAGYMREYEVKMSRKDFQRDAEKRSRHGLKHYRLAAGDARGPTRFWFVTPAGLLTPAELPAWAGLIEMSDSGCWWRRREREVVKAPALHRLKASDGVRQHARSVLYYRMHRLLLNTRQEI